MEDTYLWVKSLHIIAVISWMAGILYLPRIFVYHAEAMKGSELDKVFQTMERRLMRIIMLPSMVATYIFGFWLASLLHAWKEPWFHMKIALIAALTVFHMFCAHWRKCFMQGKNVHSHRFFRITNEIAPILMIGIVLLVVLKPLV